MARPAPRAAHLPSLPSEQRPLDRLPIEMVAGHLQLEHHLVMALCLGPWRGQLLEAV